MGQGRPTGRNLGDASAGINLDLRALRAAPDAARQLGRATATELVQAFKLVENEQKLALTQARTTLTALRGQETQLTAAVKAESQVRVATAKAESVAVQQAAKAATTTQIEEQKRLTASHRAELRAREAAERQSQRAMQVSAAGGGGGGIGGFVGGVARGALGSMGGPIGALTGSLGSGAGLAAGGLAAGVGLGAFQLAKFAVDIAPLTTAYERQLVASEQLAGSQAKVNNLLRVYNEATGNAIDKATQLADVTRLQAVGFADSAQELDEFARAVRGISLATGQSQDYISQQLQLAIANKSMLRLDQIGLGVSEVKGRIDELKKANRGLSEEAIYQAAVLGAANDKFGALTRSAEGQATGLENLRRAWADLRLEAGKFVAPTVNAVAGAAATAVDAVTQASMDARANRVGVIPNGLTIPGNRAGAQAILENLQAERSRLLAPENRMPGDEKRVATNLADLDAKIKAATNSLVGFDTAIRSVKLGTEGGLSDLVRGNTKTILGSGEAAKRFTPEEEGLIVQRYLDIEEIDKQAGEQRVAVTEQFEDQRTSIIKSYEQTISREAEDFARQRARQVQELEDSIADIHTDAARREQQQALELARTISQAREDSAERVAQMEEELNRTQAERRQASRERIEEWESDRDDALVEKRKETADRLVELEKDYAKEREQAERDSRERILSAAARLDAITLFREQRQFERESQEQAQAHADQLDEERQRGREGIEQINESHDKRLADEKKALDKSIQQEQAAHDRQVAAEGRALAKRISQAEEANARQLEQQREDDELRIGEMRDDFAKRIGIEDADRAIRLGRMATDHQAQLDELDRQLGLRLTQIDDHAQKERDQIQTEFDESMQKLRPLTAAAIAEAEKVTTAAIENLDRYYAHLDELTKKYAIPLPTEGGTLPTTPGKIPPGGDPTEPTGSASSLLMGANGVITSTANTTVGGSRSLVVQVAAGAIVIHAAPGQSPSDIGDEFAARFGGVLKAMTPAGYYN